MICEQKGCLIIKKNLNKEGRVGRNLHISIEALAPKSRMGLKHTPEVHSCGFWVIRSLIMSVPVISEHV